MRAIRFPANPIIAPALDASIGANINGPSLLRTPDWLPNPLGRYYLYFAHHQGKFIRLAYADALEGPWRVYAPGTLRLEQTPCRHHIASPDVHIDEENRRILMYYHGPTREQPTADAWARRFPHLSGQRSLLAMSEDGLNFISDSEILGPSYFRVWRDPRAADAWVYALAMPGIFLRSRDGRTEFRVGPVLFDRDQRHTALLARDDILHVFYSRAGDCPERILCATIDLRLDWEEWKASEPFSILRPETEWEGGRLRLEPSQRGAIHGPARQLRDPCVYQEGDRVYLLYAAAGESGIAMAELQFD